MDDPESEANFDRVACALPDPTSPELCRAYEARFGTLGKVLFPRLFHWVVDDMDGLQDAMFGENELTIVHRSAWSDWGPGVGETVATEDQSSAVVTSWRPSRWRVKCTKGKMVEWSLAQLKEGRKRHSSNEQAAQNAAALAAELIAMEEIEMASSDKGKRKKGKSSSGANKSESHCNVTRAADLSAANAEHAAANDAQAAPTSKSAKKRNRKKKKNGKVTSGEAAPAESDGIGGVTELAEAVASVKLSPGHASTPAGKKGGQSANGKQQGEGANLDDEDMCVICLEGEKTHLLVPCGHQCLCAGCADGFNGLCPLCRTQVMMSVQVFR